MSTPDDANDESSGWFARNPVGVLVVLGVGSLALGVFFFSVTGNPGMAPAWVVLATVATVFNAVVVGRAHRSDGAATGIALTPPATSAPVAPMRRWIGGASLPGRLGRMNATAPLAVLALEGSQLTLQVRPAWLVQLFGATARYVARSSDGIEVFPTRGMLRSSGIALKPPDRATRYFWTRRREEVLAAAAAEGFAVSWEERKFVY
jgi:hypothetical protein